MAGPEIGFLFQFGTIREIVTTNAGSLTLGKLKDMACEFINTKVSADVIVSCHYRSASRTFSLASMLCFVPNDGN